MSGASGSIAGIESIEAGRPGRAPGLFRGAHRRCTPPRPFAGPRDGQSTAAACAGMLVETALQSQRVWGSACTGPAPLFIPSHPLAISSSTPASVSGMVMWGLWLASSSRYRHPGSDRARRENRRNESAGPTRVQKI